MEVTLDYKGLAGEKKKNHTKEPNAEIQFERLYKLMKDR